MTFNVASTGTVTVPLATAVPTGAPPATPGVDYTASNGTLVFDPGQTSKTVFSPVIGDSLGDGDETVSLLLAPVGGPAVSGAVVADSTATGTNVDDDVSTDFSIASIGVVEGTSPRIPPPR